MVKTRKTAQRKREQKAANAANMDFLEKQAAEPQPGPANKKQRPEELEQMLIKWQPMDLSFETSAMKSPIPEQEGPTAEQDEDESSDDEFDPLDVKQMHVDDDTLQETETVGVVGALNSVPQNVSETHEGISKTLRNMHEQCETRIATLEKRNSYLTAENTRLMDTNKKLTDQNWKLQCKLVQDNNKKTFFTVDTVDKTGYPTPEWLLKASQVAKDSDYLFIKELMMYLWPKGVGRGTTSGRVSNNPGGKKKQDGNTATEPTVGPSSVSATTPTANANDTSAKLDPSKVKFIKDCLLQRREILGDEYGLANELAKKATQHINRVLANNPLMKSISG
ncbi:uncharacterized protein LOC109410623 [Aedes albopictus]|uniref:BEN domain-containing protein n=1 Tax=Aedes albopictus TaxID=7160 RepID=A0ABM1Y600_AEDAL